jgi:hypothetical protein
MDAELALALAYLGGAAVCVMLVVWFFDRYRTLGRTAHR